MTRGEIKNAMKNGESVMWQGIECDIVGYGFTVDRDKGEVRIEYKLMEHNNVDSNGYYQVRGKEISATNRICDRVHYISSELIDDIDELIEKINNKLIAEEIKKNRERTEKLYARGIKPYRGRNKGFRGRG